MAGKKAFEADQVLQQVMNLFWKRGYEGTSVEDLVACTGIGRGSMYDTFGDKHSLYLATLDCYCSRNQAQFEAFRQQSGPLREVLTSLFQTYTDWLLGDPHRRGCFLVNASVELAPHDPDVRKRVQTAYQAMEETFYLLLVKAQAAGELAWTYDPHQFAHFLLGTLISIRVLARTHAERDLLQNFARTALSVFD